MKTLSWQLKETLNLFLKQQCPLCQRSTPEEFCQTCKRQLQRCQFSNNDLPQPEQLTIFAWGHYSGALKRSIGALKYENKPHLAHPLGQWLAQAWLLRASPLPKLTVVPIPMHESKRKQRGFNQAELLAERFCQVTHLPLETCGLERLRETEAQFNLSAGDRDRNLTGAFSLGKSFLRQRPPGSVLLLDDIYTTGATAKSAAQTLRRHGISVYGMVVVARAVHERDNAQTKEIKLRIKNQ